MEVSDAIAHAREKSESMSRVARILARIKPVIYSTGTTIRFDGDDLDFFCMTEDDAHRLAKSIPVELTLGYRGSSTILRGTTHVQGVDFNFTVPTIRKIRLADCEVKRKRRPSVCGWREARLIFCELELVKLSYQGHTLRSNKLKEKLWNMAIKQKAENKRLEKFEFVE